MPKSIYVPLLHPADHREIAQIMPMPLGRKDAKQSRIIFSTWIAAHRLGVSHRYVQGRVDRTTLRTRGERFWRAGVIHALAREQVLGLDWVAIFSPEAAATRNRVAEGRWYGLSPRRRLIAKFRAEVESEWRAASDRLAAASSNGDGLAMLKPIVGLDDLSPAAKRYAMASGRGQGTTAGGAADAVVSLGDERQFVRLANIVARDTNQEVLRCAERSDDPADRLDAWLVRHHVRSRQHRPIVSVPVDWLRHRDIHVCGIRASVVDTEDGPLLDLDGEQFPTDLLDGMVPADQGFFRLRETMPRLGIPCPF